MRQVLQAKEKIENQTRIEKYMMLVEKGYVLYYTHQCPINAIPAPIACGEAADFLMRSCASVIVNCNFQLRLL